MHKGEGVKRSELSPRKNILFAFQVMNNRLITISKQYAYRTLNSTYRYPNITYTRIVQISQSLRMSPNVFRLRTFSIYDSDYRISDSPDNTEIPYNAMWISSKNSKTAVHPWNKNRPIETTPPTRRFPFTVIVVRTVFNLSTRVRITSVIDYKTLYSFY